MKCIYNSTQTTYIFKKINFVQCSDWDSQGLVLITGRASARGGEVVKVQVQRGQVLGRRRSVL